MTDGQSHDSYYNWKIIEDGGPRVEYFDLSGEDVTPMPLYIPEQEEVKAVEKHAAKTRTHSIMHTFMRMAGAVYTMAGLGAIEESKLFRDKFDTTAAVDKDDPLASAYPADDLDSLGAEAEAALIRGSSTSKQSFDKSKSLSKDDELKMEMEPGRDSMRTLADGSLEALPAMSDCHIDILLKESETHWMLILTGTCAEVEGDEQIQRKKVTKDAATETTAEKPDGEKQETTTSTQASGEDETKESTEGPTDKKAETEKAKESEKEQKDKKKVEESLAFISHKYDLNHRWSQTIDFPRKKKGTQSDIIATSDTGSQVISKDLLFR